MWIPCDGKRNNHLFLYRHNTLSNTHKTTYTSMYINTHTHTHIFFQSTKPPQFSMELNRRSKRSPSGDKFSFPVIASSSGEFEFGSATSPASPADHLFSNGKLLPHSFPIQSPNSTFSRSTSHASLLSSRSNSTNSRTSARTSTSDAATPERWPLPHDHYAAGRKKERIINGVSVNASWQCQYGSGRRWQLIAAAPALKQQRRRRAGGVDRKVRGGGEEGSCDGKGSKSWFKRSFLKSFVSVCQEIHAIKT